MAAIEIRIFDPCQWTDPTGRFSQQIRLNFLLGLNKSCQTFTFPLRSLTDEDK